MSRRDTPDGEDSAPKGKETLQIFGKLLHDRDEAEAKRDDSQYRTMKLAIGVVLAVVIILGGMVGVYLSIPGGPSAVPSVSVPR